MGGAERQAYLQARELSRVGHFVMVVCPRWRSSSPAMQKIDGAIVRRLPMLARRPFVGISYLVALAWFLLRTGRRFDVIHVHLANNQADLVCLVAKVIGRPVYLKVAGGGVSGEIGRRKDRGFPIGRFLGLRWASVVQALSSEIAEELTLAGVKPGRIVRVPNGLDLGPMALLDADGKAAVRERLGIAKDGLIFLFVGRFAYYKGVADLLAAWESPVRGATLTLVGTYDTEDAVPPITPTGELDVRGWADDPREFMLAADVFVHPAHADGMSNAVLEAFGCGLPTIATASGASTGFLVDGENSLLYAPGDTATLAKLMKRLAANNGLRERLGEGGRRTAERHDIRLVEREIVSIYRAVARQ